MAGNKKTCTCCGKSKASNVGFYLSHSNLYRANDGRMAICKDCLFERYKELLLKYEDDEIKAIYHLCMNLDVYFNKELVESSFKQEGRSNKPESLLKVYLTKINSLMQYKGMNSIGSDFVALEECIVEEINDKQEEKEIEEDIDYDNMKIPTHIKKRWGSGYNNEEYIFLEDNYAEFYDAYSHETPAERMLLVNISKSLLEAERSRKAGKTKEYENMMKLVSSMLTDANIKPSQKKTKGDEIGECFGVFIENIEKNEPIGEEIEEFEDVDNIGKLIDRQFVKNFAKVFGLVGDDNEDED